MKVILVTLFILLSSFFSFGQKTKTVEIWKKPRTGEILEIMYIEHKETGRIDTLIHFMAQDHQYWRLIDMITVYSGTPKEFYSFINKVEKFFKENEPNTSDYIDEYKVLIKEFSGRRGVWIYERRDRGNGFHAFTMKELAKFKTMFVDWCKKNKVAYE